MAAVRKEIQTLDKNVSFFHSPDSGCLKDTRMLPPSIQPSRARRGWAKAASCLPGEGHGDLVWWGGVGLGLGEGCRRAVEPWCEAGAMRCRGWRQQGQEEMERAAWERLDRETCNALAFLCYL